MYGYRKRRTRAIVFSRTLDHANSKNEIRQKKTEEEGKKEKVKMERRQEGKSENENKYSG